jgi:hypothetical protein
MCSDSSIKEFCGAALYGLGLCIAVCSILAGLIWSIVDGANMLQGKIADGNGYAMY